MKFLTLEYIKSHSRICGDCENEKLMSIGAAAEEAVLNYLDRTVAELEEMNGGELPESVMLAASMMADYYYENPSMTANDKAVTDATGCLLLPYIKL